MGGVWSWRSGDGLACPACGSEDLDTVPIPLLRRAGRWLTDGTPVPRHEDRCARCGERRARGTWTTYGAPRGPTRWLRLALQPVNAVRHNRTWLPPPIFYVGALLVGAVVGVVADVVLGMAWWLLAVAGPVVVFALSLVGLIRHRPRRRALRDDLVAVFAPRRHLAQIEAATVARYRDVDLPLYGLAGWHGERWAAGVERDPQSDETIAITLAHDEGPTPNGPRVEVSARRRWRDAPPSSPAVDPAGDGSDRATQALTAWIAEEASRPAGMPDPADPGPWLAERRRRRHEVARSLAATEPRDDRVEVDGEPRPSRLLRHGDVWAAWTQVDGLYLDVRAHGIAPADVALVSVEDIEPYLDGLRARWRRHRDEPDGAP